MNNQFWGGGLPLGFGISLIQDAEAYNKFSRMSDHQKRCVIDGAHAFTSRAEKNAYVSRIAAGDLDFE